VDNNKPPTIKNGEQNNKIERSYTPIFLAFVGYTSEQSTIHNRKFQILVRYIIRLLYFLVITQSILIPLLYIAFYFSGYKALPIAVFGTTVLPFIFSIIFIVLFLLLKREFAISQQTNPRNNGQIVEPNIFNRGHKYYISCIGTSFGYFIGLIILATLNLTKFIKYNNVLNIILPIVLVVFTILITSLIQNFGWFLDEVSRIELDRVKNNNGIYTYSVTIKTHEWQRLRRIAVVGDKLIQFCESCRRSWYHDKFEFVGSCESLLRRQDPETNIIIRQ
jgi:hypothetical protein